MSREPVRGFAAESLARGEPLAWFEQVYAAAPDASAVPWADLEPNPELVDWLDGRDLDGSALVVGCGLGDDAEELAARGLAVTAFDLAPTAIAWARRRFPETRVDYVVADALDPPADWEAAFDVVFEAYTLQALPPDVRAGVAATVVWAVRPGGLAVVVARGRDPEEPASGPPWPLTRDELRTLFAPLAEESLDDHDDATGVRRLRLVARQIPPRS